MLREILNQAITPKKVSTDLRHFGGWVTVSSLINPLMTQSDRVLIGSLISTSAVTLYVIPYELTVQTTILVGAITTIAFPVITHLLHTDPTHALRAFSLWLYRSATMMFCLLITLAFALPIVLPLWLGSHATDTSVHIGQILCIGVFFNAIGSMYFSLLHAQGKTRMTAMLHIVELPFFIVILYISINKMGGRSHIATTEGHICFCYMGRGRKKADLGTRSFWRKTTLLWLYKYGLGIRVRT